MDTVSRFKSPNQKSKEALNSETVKIGDRQLTIQPELKEKALRISSYLVRIFFFPIFAAHFVVFAKPSLQCYNCCSIESFITLFSMK